MSLTRSSGALLSLICFAVVCGSGYKAADSAFADQAAGPALVAFNVYLLPAVVSTYGLVEALKQAVDGENRLWHVGAALFVVLCVVAASSWLIGLAD